MANYSTPFVSTPYDRRDETGRMSDLIRTRGAIEARQHEASGAIKANLWANVGQTIGSSLAQLGQIAADAPKRKLEERRVADEIKARDEQDRFTALEKDVATMGMSDRDRIQTFKTKGFTKQAQAEEDRFDNKKLDTLKIANAEFESSKNRLGQAADIMRGVTMNPDPAGAYGASIGKVKELVGPEYAKFLPDQYDPKAVDTALAFGEDARETLAWQGISAQRAAAALAAKEHSADRNMKFRESLSSWLRVTKTPEAWNEALTYAKNLEMPESLITSFGEFSPENVAKAATIADGMDKTKDSEFEKYYLNGTPETRARFREYKQAGVAPPQPREPRGQLTAGDHIRIEQWSQDERNKLLEHKRKGTGPFQGVKTEDRADVMKDEQDRIDRSATMQRQGANPMSGLTQGRQTARPPKVDDVVTVDGKTYTVGKVHPDGSWDPKD